MRKFETPYMADWFAISLRWIMLVGLIISLGLGQQLGVATSWPLGLIVIWNLVMTALASLNVRMSGHRRISFMVDLALAGIFYWVQGGSHGPVFWVGLLPILTSSIYFELSGAAVAALTFSVLVIFTGIQVDKNLPLALIVAATMILLSLVFGYLGKRMIIHIRQNRSMFMD